MDIAKMIMFLIFAFGLSEILVFYEGPFDLVQKFREWTQNRFSRLGKVFNCPVCTSSWVGIVSSTLNYFFIPTDFTPWNIILNNSNMWYVIIPMDLFTTAGFVLLLFHIDERITKDSIEYED